MLNFNRFLKQLFVIIFVAGATQLWAAKKSENSSSKRAGTKRKLSEVFAALPIPKEPEDFDADGGLLLPKVAEDNSLTLQDEQHHKASGKQDEESDSSEEDMSDAAFEKRHKRFELYQRAQWQARRKRSEISSKHWRAQQENKAAKRQKIKPFFVKCCNPDCNAKHEVPASAGITQRQLLSKPFYCCDNTWSDHALAQICYDQKDRFDYEDDASDDTDKHE